MLLFGGGIFVVVLRSANATFSELLALVGAVTYLIVVPICFPYQSLNGDIKNYPAKCGGFWKHFHLQLRLLILFTPVQLFF